jgi:hypothetical protein
MIPKAGGQAFRSAWLTSVSMRLAHANETRGTPTQHRGRERPLGIPTIHDRVVQTFAFRSWHVNVPKRGTAPDGRKRPNLGYRRGATPSQARGSAFRFGTKTNSSKTLRSTPSRRQCRRRQARPLARVGNTRLKSWLHAVQLQRTHNHDQHHHRTEENFGQVEHIRVPVRTVSR